MRDNTNLWFKLIYKFDHHKMCIGAFLLTTSLQSTVLLTKRDWVRSIEALVLVTNHIKILQWPERNQNISATVLAMMKLFVPFCSAQDSESADVNCLVF